MHKVQPGRAPLALLLGVLVALTACDRPESTQVPSEPQHSSLTGASLVPCPSDQETAGIGLIGIVGGVVSTAGNTVYVPPEAIQGPTEIAVEIPASDYMLVDLTANGQEHWQFLAPITVTIDYSRCAIRLFAPPVTVWHVDPATGEMLEPMGGTDDRLLKRVTFTTDHFSGYAIAN